MKKQITALTLTLVMILFAGIGCAAQEREQGTASEIPQTTQETAAAETGQTPAAVEDVPDYAGEPYIVIDDNEPDFQESDFKTEAFESYSELDDLGRCGAAMANIGRELMPRQDRGSIGQIKPSGWKTQRYDHVDGNYLYNRCHLIGYQLTGENANEKNLITGTREMNVEGMLPFENMVADYIKETGNHVLYRVTPIFEGQNLLASGVQMEAESVEDRGDDLCFNVYVYNNQPGVAINYETGESALSGGGKESIPVKDSSKDQTQDKYVLNTNTGKFHEPGCRSISDMKEENKSIVKESRQSLMKKGYEPCKLCQPLV